MKKILIPISFSQSSANSLKKANSLFKNSELTLLHCYSPDSYNRAYDFETKNYEQGIKELLIDFYKKHIVNHTSKIRIIASAGSVSESIAQISHRFDLLVMSKKQRKETSGYWLSDKVFYIASKGHCPVLLLPVFDNSFDFTQCKSIWHIKRKEIETKILNENLPKIDLNPKAVEVKSLEQTTFKSTLWKSILSFTKTHDQALLKKISEANNLEKIDLIILVSHGKDTFQKFMRAEVIQIILQYNIPILVFQAERLNPDD